MEPIRPDDDELRAERPVGAPERKGPARQKPGSSVGGAGGSSGPAKPGRSSPKSSGGSGRSGLGLLWLLVIVMALAIAGGWYLQNQRIQMLEGQLEEADYWARQSKLAIARFEGDLSETGENLQERGASMSEQLEAQKKRLDEADSEIRKLWAIANERNKQRLNEQEKRIAAAERSLAENEKAVADLSSGIEKVRTSLGDDVASLTRQMETSISALQEANRQATEQLTRLSKQMAEVDQVVERRVRRFEQEQKLGISNMESRLSALERKLSDSRGDRALKNDLAALKENVQAIDSSRSQLTSRLVRLSEEVNRLRNQLAAQ